MNTKPQSSTISSAWVRQFEIWLCDGYSVDIRYLASDNPDSDTLVEAIVALNPLPHGTENNLTLQVPTLDAGRFQQVGVSKSDILALVTQALNGSLTIATKTYTLPKGGDYVVRESPFDQGGWFTPLSIQVVGAASGPLLDRKGIDDALRAARPPFDGMPPHWTRHS